MQYKVVASPILYPEVKEIPRNKLESNYKVLDTHVNLEWLLSHFKADIKYNLMTRRREITIPDHYISQEDYDNEALSLVEYLATLNDMPIKKINEHLNKLSLQNAYHPIVECIKNNPWDGVNRVDKFLETIQSANQELSNKILRTWMRSAIAAAHSSQGFTSHGAIVIQGKQGIGKTAWIKSLDPINCGAVKDGAILEPNLKDCVIGLSQFWIIELGELDATYRRSDIARIKSFITMNFDFIRNPYARLDNKRPRRSVYIGTVNNPDYLVDDTGNRRWWTIEAASINYQHGFDMKQVWAEIHHEWQKGELTYLDKELQEEVNMNNANFEQIDPLEEQLSAFFNWSSPLTKEMTVTEILKEMRWPLINQSSANKLSKILTKKTGLSAIRNGKNGERMRKVPCLYKIYSDSA
jgi:putative DNA primase/helicase